VEFPRYQLQLGNEGKATRLIKLGTLSRATLLAETAD
jgi:hypothetical protein